MPLLPMIANIATAGLITACAVIYLFLTLEWLS